MQQTRIREESPESRSESVTTTDQDIARQEGHTEPEVILHLRVISNPDERRVTWDEQVVDNENMGKKSSKGALLVLYECIFLDIATLTDGIDCSLLYLSSTESVWGKFFR
jgi:Protein phosphatase inhibitor